MVRCGACVCFYVSLTRLLTADPVLMSAAPKPPSPFVTKLYEMANEVFGQDECFKWSDDGQSFWVSNAEQFSRDVLPAYFKHNNYASFVRQLNLYGVFDQIEFIMNIDCHYV